MWTATVARTERNEDRLDIIVTYTDGTNEFSKTYSTDSIPGDSTWLNTQITNQLTKLSDLDTFETDINNQNIVKTTLQIDPVTLQATSVSIDQLPSKSKLVGG